MRAGVIISAISHVVLVSLALLGTPTLFDSAQPPAIEVDLVPPDEVKPAPEEKPEPEKPVPWDIPAEKPAPWPAAPPPPAASSPAPDNSQQAAARPETQSQSAAQSPSPSAPQEQPQANTTPSIFDPANIPKLLDLPNAPEKGFDAEATTSANLTNEERAAFKAHLRKCWKLPGSLSPAQSTRVVLRIYLRRDGGLATDPVLIEASASRDGPLLLKTAMRALKDCQPFGFLPADKYSEWRVLDLSFTPRDMAGG